MLLCKTLRRRPCARTQLSECRHRQSWGERTKSESLGEEKGLLCLLQTWAPRLRITSRRRVPSRIGRIRLDPRFSTAGLSGSTEWVTHDRGLPATFTTYAVSPRRSGPSAQKGPGGFEPRVWVAAIRKVDLRANKCEGPKLSQEATERGRGSLSLWSPG